MNTTPEPYRSPLGWNVPTVIASGLDTVTVQVSIPNENPETEDDLTLTFTIAPEGLTIEALVSGGDPVATYVKPYDELWMDLL